MYVKIVKLNQRLQINIRNMFVVTSNKWKNTHTKTRMHDANESEHKGVKKHNFSIFFLVILRVHIEWKKKKLQTNRNILIFPLLGHFSGVYIVNKASASTKNLMCLFIAKTSC